MKLLAALLAVTLVQAAPRVEESRVPMGSVRSWMPQHGAWTFTSAGVRVHFAAQRCPPGRSEACDLGFAGQARMTVRAPGLAPFTFDTAGEGIAFSAAVIRFDKRDSRPGIIVATDTGGSAGTLYYRAVIPRGNGFVIADIKRARGNAGVSGDLSSAVMRDVDGDGRIDFILRDDDFHGTFGCHGCTPEPPVVVTLIGGRSVDISHSPGARAVFAADLPARRAACLSRKAERNGSCAAYAADAARLGRFDAAWREILAHYDRDGWQLWQPPTGKRFADFPSSLRGFLKDRGYI